MAGVTGFSFRQTEHVCFCLCLYSQSLGFRSYYDKYHKGPCGQVCVPAQDVQSVCELQLSVLCVRLQPLVVVLQLFQSELQSRLLLAVPPQR